MAAREADVRERRHVVPVLLPHAERRPERDDVRRRRELAVDQGLRTLELRRVPRLGETCDDRRRHLGVRLRPARYGAERQAGASGRAFDEGGGDDALDGAVVADEDDRIYSVTMVAQDDPRLKWALLAYRLPREPSTPRIAVWRKLRRLGVAQLHDGLVALPLDNRNREQLEWLADEIREAGGEATLWLGELASAAEERALVGRLAGSVAAEYRRIATAASNETPSRRTLGRLRRELHRVRLRDYFPPPERQHAHRAVERLAQRTEELAA